MELLIDSLELAKLRGANAQVTTFERRLAEQAARMLASAPFFYQYDTNREASERREKNGQE